ncbi:hypothetical protein [Oceanospirillum sp.]|uniref:hypothetical protein n=1 Tax=Oceanospirillum sp. TaxID=2021254 RepID=UPI003A8E2B62
MSLKQRLIKMSQDTRLNLRRVTIGTIIFFVGAGMLMWAEGATHLEPLRRELVALLSLITMGIGAMLGLLGYLGLSAFRIYRFLSTDVDKPSRSEKRTDQNDDN